MKGGGATVNTQEQDEAHKIASHIPMSGKLILLFLVLFPMVLTVLFKSSTVGWVTFAIEVVITIGCMILASTQKNQIPEDLTKKTDDIRKSIYGPVNIHLVCPHCQTKGNVRTRRGSKEKGISGSKATGAVITGGISVLATGLARSEDVIEAHCDVCKCDWII